MAWQDRARVRYPRGSASSTPRAARSHESRQAPKPQGTRHAPPGRAGARTRSTMTTHHFKSVSFTGLASGPRLMITGAVHGNETCGTQAIGRVLNEIDSGALKIARGRVTFVPVTNPLAYARKDRIGDRNLNRNL